MPSLNSQPKTPPLNLVAIRQRYQKALLTWLKAPEVDDGLRQMRAVLGAVALIQPPEFVKFWRDAEAVLQAALDGKIAVDAELRKITSRLDGQFKQLVRENPVPDSVLWDDIIAFLERQPPKEDVSERVAPTKPLFDATHPLADMLARTASILPFVAQVQLPRFSEEATETWRLATAQLLETWHKRYQQGWGDFRSAVFGGLCGAALKIGEPAFLRFSEAMASAMDRIDDDVEPPVHLVAAIAAALESLESRDFLEHAALYSRLDIFATRLEKVVDEEVRISRVVRGMYSSEFEVVPEVRVPQQIAPLERTPEQQSIYDYFNQLNAVEVVSAEDDADQAATVPTDDVVLSPVKLETVGLHVDDIPLVQWDSPSPHEVQEPAPSHEPEELALLPVLPVEDTDAPELDAAEVADVAEEVVEVGVVDTHSVVEASSAVFKRKPFADGQLLGRVARDLEALAESLHLSGLARQAGELATLVDRIEQTEVNHSEVRADLLQVIQFMQDQVGAVVMGFPPHANPKINALMRKLESYLPEEGSSPE